MTAVDSHQSSMDSHLDESGEALLYEELRNYWHPVAYAADLADGGPVQGLLLGEPLVIVRLGGEIRIFRDLCSHRGTAISLGWVEEDQLRCPYHGPRRNQHHPQLFRRVRTHYVTNLPGHRDWES